MQRTPRQIRVQRAVLRALEAIPEGYMLPDDLLRIESARMVIPAPTTAELDIEISHADANRRIIGIPGDESVKWKLADPGRAWLAEHR